MKLTPWWRRKKTLASARCLPTSRRRSTLPPSRCLLGVEMLEERALPSALVFNAQGHAAAAGVVNNGTPNTYQFSSGAGFLSVSVSASGPTRLKLLANDDSTVLGESDGNATITLTLAQHLQPDVVPNTFYYLEVDALSGSGDAYNLSADLQATLRPFQTLSLGTPGQGNGVGLATPLQNFAQSISAVDSLLHDGSQDLIVVNPNTDTTTIPSAPTNVVQIFQPVGDGPFRARQDISVSTNPGGKDALGNDETPVNFAVADLNGDGRDDIVVANRDYLNTNAGDPTVGGGSVTILLNLGKDAAGNFVFAAPITLSVPVNPTTGNAQHPIALTVGNFGDSGGLSIAVVTVEGQTVPDPPATTADDGSVVIIHNTLVAGNHVFTVGSTPNSDLFDVGPFPVAIAAGNFDGSGPQDLAVVVNDAINSNGGAVAILLAQGGGTFQLQGGQALATGRDPISLTVAKIQHPGGALDDLLVADSFNVPTAGEPTGGVTILFGSNTGLHPAPTPDVTLDGTLYPGYLQGTGTFAIGTHPNHAVIGDFNGDGLPDLLVVSNGTSDVDMALGIAGGGFGTPRSFPAFTGGGVGSPNTPMLLSPTDSNGWLATDLDGDGRPDIVTGDNNGNVVSVLVSDGKGGFLAPQQTVLDPGNGLFGPYGAFGVADIQAADVTGDGHPDLFVISQDGAEQDVSVLRNVSGGQFQHQSTFAAGSQPTTFLHADFNNDGVPDLAVLSPNTPLAANDISNNISILLAVGDGTFRNQIVLPSALFGGSLTSMVTGDLNGDGISDLAVGVDSGTAGNVMILLGIGNGQFRTGQVISVGRQPVLQVGDFGGSLHADLAVLDSGDNDVRLLRGQGDGTFLAAGTFALPKVMYNPTSLLVGHFSQDAAGNPVVGLAVYGSGGEVDVFRGSGAGSTFTLLSPERLGGFDVSLPLFVALVPTGIDHNSSNSPDDLIVAGFAGVLNYTVVDLLRNTFVPGTGWTFQYGGGSFGITIPGVPTALVLGDFSGNGTTDVAVATSNLGGIGFGANNVAILDETRDASNNFTGYAVAPGSNQGFTAGGAEPDALLAGHFSGNSIEDVAVAFQSGNVGILTYNTGTHSWDGFNGPYLGAGGNPVALLSGDFNRDGQADLAVLNQSSSDVTSLLGTGNSAPYFTDAGTILSAVRATPVVTNLDGFTDLLVTTQDGRVLFRSGNTGIPGTFQAPIPVVDPRLNPARDATVVDTLAGGRLVAVADAIGHAISFYAYLAVGGPHFVPADPTQYPALDLGSFTPPTRVVAANLDKNPQGLKDYLVVLVPSQGQVDVYAPQAGGGFNLSVQLTVGQGFTDLSVVPQGDGFADIVLTNQVTGDVLVLTNDLHTAGNSPGVFGFGVRARASTNIYNTQGDPGGSPLSTQTREGTNGVVVAPFHSSTTPANDILAINPGSNSFGLLPNNDASAGITTGSFLNPTVNPILPLGTVTPWPLGFSPAAVTWGYFNGDNNPDIALLDAADETIHIYLGDGQGHFTVGGGFASGSSPTGLSAADVNGDGKADLLVGNGNGDLLILFGIGDGTFRPPQPADFGQNVALLVTSSGALTANQANSHVTSFVLPAGATTFTPATSIGQGGIVQHPGNAAYADLNGDGLLDLIVPNTGSNSITVSLATDATGLNYLAPQTFFVGTSPVGIAVRDLNADGIPDLAVANQGSNDVSILYGIGTRNAATGLVSNWGLSSGPRYAVGAGPTAVSFADVAGRGSTTPDGAIDLVVSNAQNGTFTVLPGIGTTGFFDGTRPISLNLPGTTPAAGRNDIQQVDFDHNLLLTGGGSIVRFDLGDLANFTQNAAVIFNTPAGADLPNFFTAAAAGAQTVLFVGTEGGAVDVLGPDAQGNLTEIAPPITSDQLHDISELALVNTDGENFELYATNAGDDTPVVIDFHMGIAVLQPPPDVALPGQQQPGADLTPTTPGSLETVATLGVGLPELVSHESDLSGITTGQPGEESLHGILVATLTVIDAGGDATTGGDGETIIDTGTGIGGEEVPTLEAFVAGLPGQFREVLAGQERAVNPTGFDDQWQAAVGAAFRQGDDLGAGLDGLREGSAGVLGEVRQPLELLSAVGSTGTGDEWDWRTLWRPTASALRQIGESAVQVGGELGPQFLPPFPEAAPARPPLLDTPLPKPIGGDAPPPEPTRPQSRLSEGPDDRRIAAMLGLAALLGYAFGGNGLFAEDKFRTGP